MPARATGFGSGRSGGKGAADLGQNGAGGHETSHGLGRAALAAEMEHVGISALGKAPGHEGEPLVGLVLLETGDIAEHDHPPVIGIGFFLATDIACERHIPDHGGPPIAFRSDDASQHYLKIRAEPSKKRGKF